MKKVWLLTIAFALAPGAALAQEAETTTPDGTVPPPEPAPAPVAPVEETPAEEEAAAEEEEESNWYDNLTIGAFADAYYMVDWNFPEVGTASQLVGHRGYDAANGFNVAFAGLDLSYAGENVGATIQLRYGQGADRLLIGTGFGDVPGSANLKGYFGLKQAFVSWMPTEGLQLDVGQFDTIYGAEVSESYLNINYSRSALYYLMQPFYHTGLRLTYALSDTITLKGLVVNGINNGIDNNFSPMVGAQIVVAPSDTFQLYAGYATGSAFGVGITNPSVVEPRSDSDWLHFFDVVANLQLGDFRLLANADFWLTPNGDDFDFSGGVSVAAQYALSDTFGLGARVDFLFNADAFFVQPYEQLVTGTLTADYHPVENLTIRLEHRIEFADEDVFATGQLEDDGAGGLAMDTQAIWNATTLSLVVHTN